MVMNIKEIRVFGTNKMKAYDSEDVNPDDIVNISKDIKVKGDYGSYLVNKVVLKNNKKGYIWSENQKFD
jgi:hypothetical protein